MKRRETEERPSGGVLVVRVWSDAGGVLIGRVRWETDNGERHTLSLRSANAFLKEVQTFLDRTAQQREEPADGSLGASSVDGTTPRATAP
jgi:hypothetical protein